MKVARILKGKSPPIPCKIMYEDLLESKLMKEIFFYSTLTALKMYFVEIVVNLLFR